MATRPPTATRILIAVGFALSCFGLALFLWLAFGGPVPLKPESYQVHVPVREATQLAVESDVRISGVSVGKVKDISLADNGSADVTIEMDPQFAPIPEDTHAQLREKTLLGETYVELTPGSQDGPTVPEGGSIPEAHVSDSVQLDEIFRAFDTRTREAFRAWMQGAALALKGRGDDLNIALGSLDPFAEDADRALRLLDSQRLAVRKLVRDGGEVFQALSERKGQLRGLISNSNQVFATTAARNADLEEIFRIFPTFERESRATLERLAQFSGDADPLIQQLRPAARELSPTLIDIGRLSPELKQFFIGLRGTINASDPGFPALRRLLSKDLTPLLGRYDGFGAQLDSILEAVGLYKHEITALFANVAAATLNVESESGDNGSFSFNNLRTEAPLGPEALAAYPRRLQYNRSNPYVEPLGFLNLTTNLEGFETRQCGSGIHATLQDADAPSFPGDLYDRIKLYAFNNLNDSNALPTPPCDEQGPLQSIGVSPEMTKYLHVRKEP
jgi:phospholipid/cholesterol/gamma-HCH transport system substrate-binding protein